MPAVQAQPYPLLVWEPFDRPDGTGVSSIPAFTQGSGSALSVSTGALTSSGRGSCHVEAGARPARVEASFFPNASTALNGVRVRHADEQNGYEVEWDPDDTSAGGEGSLALYEVVSGSRTLLGKLPTQFGPDGKWFHWSVVVDDSGDDLVVHVPDQELTIRASDSPSFTNAHAAATRVGFYGVGNTNGADLRTVRLWESVPAWDGQDHVEPAWGAQHIWTRVHCRHRGVHDRTYYGWADPYKGVQVRYFDHGTNTFSEVVTVHKYGDSVRWAYDDHHPPGVYVHSDGRVWLFIQAHKDNNIFFVLRANDPESLTGGWQAPVNLWGIPGQAATGVYPRAYRVADGSVVVFFRIGGSNNGEWFARRTTDGGATWDYTKLVDNTEGHVYQFFRQDPDDPDHIVAVGNLKYNTGSNYEWRNVYCWKSLDGGRTWRHVTTATPVTLPASASDFEVVHADLSERHFVTGHAVKADGTPRILAARKNDPDHEIVSWDYRGGSWQVAVVSPSVEWPAAANYDEGDVWRPSGGEVNYHDTDEIATSVAEVGGRHHVKLYRTSDGGATWTKTRDLTPDAAVGEFRPTFIEGVDSTAFPTGFRLNWHSGEFYGTTPAATGGGQHFDGYFDVQIVTDLQLATLRGTTYVPGDPTTDPEPNPAPAGTASVVAADGALQAGALYVVQPDGSLSAADPVVL